VSESEQIMAETLASVERVAALAKLASEQNQMTPEIRKLLEECKELGEKIIAEATLQSNKSE
jgi:glutaredoxin 2